MKPLHQVVSWTPSWMRAGEIQSPVTDLDLDPTPSSVPALAPGPDLAPDPAPAPAPALAPDLAPAVLFSPDAKFSSPTLITWELPWT